jgi:hypothetical protein
MMPKRQLSRTKKNRIKNNSFDQKTFTPLLTVDDLLSNQKFGFGKLTFFFVTGIREDLLG